MLLNVWQQPFLCVLFILNLWPQVIIKPGTKHHTAFKVSQRLDWYCLLFLVLVLVVPTWGECVCTECVWDFFYNVLQHRCQSLTVFKSLSFCFLSFLLRQGGLLLMLLKPCKTWPNIFLNFSYNKMYYSKHILLNNVVTVTSTEYPANKHWCCYCTWENRWAGSWCVAASFRWLVTWKSTS